MTGIGENTLAQPVKPPLRERCACLAKLVKNRLTLTALILRDPFRPLLAACAAAAAVAPDIKVLEGRVVSGDQFVSPAEQKERILATFGDLCCEMEGCTIAQGPFQSEVSSRSVERRP